MIGAVVADWRRQRLARREIRFRSARLAAELAVAVTDEQRVEAFLRGYIDIGNIAGFTADDWHRSAAQLEEQWKNKLT